MRRPIEVIMKEIEEGMEEKRRSNKHPNVSYPKYTESQLRTIAIRQHELLYQNEAMKEK